MTADQLTESYEFGYQVAFELHENTYISECEKVVNYFANALCTRHIVFGMHFRKMVADVGKRLYGDANYFQEILHYLDRSRNSEEFIDGFKAYMYENTTNQAVLAA